MMRVITFVMMLLVPSMVWAQWVPPDDRYKGYPRELIEWPKNPPTTEQLKACEDQEYYEPADFHLAEGANRVKVAGTPRVLKVPECRWMLTAHSDPAKRWRLVMRPVGTKICVDEQGRDLFDCGSETGKPCYNPTPLGWPILPPMTVVPAPVLRVPIREQIRTGIYVPKYEEPEDDVVVVPAVLVPQNKGGICSGRKGLLCALVPVAVCFVGYKVNDGVCGIRFSSEDGPPSNRPSTIPPPPPNITPVKPPG